MKKLAQHFDTEKKKETDDVDMTQANSLRDAIDEYIDSGIEKQFKQSEGFSMSKNNYCPRFWFYLFTGIEYQPNHGSRVQRIFDTGNAVHERIQGYFEKMGILEEAEAELPQPEDTVPLRGFADAIIRWEGRKIVEIKSISHEGFVYRQAARKPKDDHYNQLQVYLHCFEIQDGYLIYENKNTQELLVLPVKYDGSRVKKILKKYDKIWSIYQKGELPARPYKETSKNCQYCMLNEYCWSDSNDGVKT